MAQASAESERTNGSGSPAKKTGARKIIGQTFIGMILLAAVAVAFFVFYVGPQSQHERDRIYRSMNFVSRLIDDRALTAGLALQTGGPRSLSPDPGPDPSPSADSSPPYFEIPGFAFGCERRNIICVRLASPNPRPPGGEDSPGPPTEASFSLRSIAENAELPYPEAILLITDSRGNVIAGYDRESKWLQFQSLRALLSTAPANASDPPLAGRGTDELQRQTLEALEVAQRVGRGEQNAVFEGYPARLTRDVGGQDYAVFVASHQVGKSLDDGSSPVLIPTVQAGPNASPSPPAGADSRPADATPADGQRQAVADASPGGPADQLYFAYLIPERVIDGAALGIAFQWTVNILILLFAGLLCIPFLKLFNRSPLKPIRVMDTVAAVIATILIVLTASLFLSAILLRNSIVQDVDRELARLSRAVADDVRKNVHGTDLLPGIEAELANRPPDPLPRNYQHQPQTNLADLAPVENAFFMKKSGRCTAPNDSEAGLCGKGIWFVEPVEENINITDRAYFKSWDETVLIGDTNYTQFLRNKSNGRLSWSRTIDNFPSFNPDGTVPALVLSWFPLSLRSPIVPRNLEFAIVLNTDLPEALRGPGSAHIGDVQFHSEQQHSLMENMIDDARGSAQLAAALRVLREPPGQLPPQTATSRNPEDGIISERIPLQYHGRNYFARVRPIAETPWSVVALYDRTEGLAIFAEAMAHAFFVGCVWIVICLAACWLAPRMLRLTLGRGSKRPDGMAVRARSIWFFPNGLSDSAPDGFSYFFRLRGDELILLLLALAGHAAALFLLPPFPAMLMVCLISLAALVGTYLLIARPHDQHPSTLVRRTALATATALFVFAVIASLVGGKSDQGLLLATIGAIACFLCLNLALIWGVSENMSRQLKPGPARRFLLEVAVIRRRLSRLRKPATLKAVRRAYVNRSIALLLVLVWVPGVAILNLYYSEYLKGYVGASLITVAEQISQQRQKIGDDLEPLMKSPLYGSLYGEDAASALNLDKFDESHPGWFMGEDPRQTTGAFVVEACVAGRRGCKPLVAGEERPSPVFASFEQMIPTFNSSIADVESTTELVAGGGRLGEPISLVQPGRFETVVSDLGRGTDKVLLTAGPIERFAFHPDFRAWVLLVLFVWLFYVALYLLIYKAATILAGLHLDRVEAEPDAVARLREMIEEEGPRAAWESLPSDEQRLFLLTLAHGRTLNFRDRSDIQALVRAGYLSLSPYLHIEDARLAEYLRYDLPHKRQAEILRIAKMEDDNWEHMRLPVLVILGVGCILLAYSSPGAIQLVFSGFLALTALLPLARDPITRVFELQKA